jgi:hypothetical protein
MGIKQFKDEAKAGEVTDAAITKAYVFDEIKALDIEPGSDVEARVFEWAISTENPDRENDAISVDGWKLDAYRKNPVVLWAHSHRDLPIATSPNVWPQAVQLRAKADFTKSSELNPLALTVARMIHYKLLNAASVGFRPIIYSNNENRGSWAYDFLEQELLEWSIVPVPANAEALQGAKSYGIDIAPLAEFAEKVLDGERGPGLWIPKDYMPREEVEKAWKIAKGEQATASVPGAKDTKDADDQAKDTQQTQPNNADQSSTKAGRVLSAANEAALRDAVASIESAAGQITTVLSAAAPAPEDDGKEAQGTVSVQPDINTKQDDDERDSEIKLLAMKDAVRELLPDLLREVITNETERALRKFTGRVD